MCGICGIMDMKGEGRAGDRAVIERMIHAIRHRGPDAQDHYLSPQLSMGFARLSIIDLQGGMQPISSEDGSVILICNGEIFNARSLREMLIHQGHQFKTGSDVEVILHLYEEHGTDFLNRLNGQFAFALYDVKRHRLFCARDQAGICPFYYTIVNGQFLFGSEIKAILEHPEVRAELDLVGLDQVMTFPGLVGTRTMFRNISSLENGHYLLIHEGGLRSYEYWDLVYPKAGVEAEPHAEAYYVQQLDELLTRSVAYRLQADVPVGCYISGGLDSSLIAAKIADIRRNGELHSYSIDFADREISEWKYQQLMAGHIGAIHHVKPFNTADMISRLRKAVWHSECALKETYNTASMALSELVREHGMKVILTGEGADELFAGYVGYRFDVMRAMNAGQPVDSAEARLREQLWGDASFVYETDFVALEALKRSLYSRQLNAMFDQFNCLNFPVVRKERIEGLDVLHKRSYLDYKLRLPEHLLADHGDRMAFAHSVEARYPFLDQELIDAARHIPPALKLKQFEEKHILKRVAGRCVPQEIVGRPKFTFVAPGSPQLVQSNDPYIRELLASETIRRQGVFDPDYVQQVKERYAQPGFKLNLPYERDELIMVITLGMFMEQFGMANL